MTGTRVVQRMLWLLAIIVAVVLLDQSIKQIMVDWIGPAADSNRYEVIGRFAAFEYLENRGAAFGLFSQGTLVLATVSVVIIAIGLVAMAHFAVEEFWLSAAIALVLGGAIGNAIDRFSRGFVVDYIAIGRFWKFNLADSAVSIGVVLIFLLLWSAENGAEHQETSQESEV